MIPQLVDKMNWLIKIIIFQLLFGQALLDLSCLNIEKCTCQKHADKEEIEVTCNSTTVKANLMDSIIAIQCNSDQIQWEQSFNQINVSKLNFNHCLLNTDIYHTISTLGINEIQNLKLVHVKFGDSLERFYLSNLESVTQLEITDSKSVLRLTNESFEGTPYLTKLFLRNNLIKELPKGIFKYLTHLVVLDLGGNQISTIDSDFCYGIPLKGLILDSNNLTTLSLNIPSLKHLDVSNNKLTSITFDKLKNLIELSLNKNSLIAMPDQPFKNTSLEFIKYNYGNFTTIPKQFLTNLDNLQKVHLKYLNIEKIPENMIWNSYDIIELSLNSNNLKELPVLFFRDSRKMKLLDLSKNRIEIINHELLKPLTQLEHLDLSNNMLIEINNFGLTYLKSLTNLNLDKNNIIFIGREALNVPKLKNLKLAHNKISNLFYDNKFSFHYLDNIEDIDLSNNKITRIDPDWYNLVKLKNINLASNNFTILGIGDIQYLNEKVKVNLNSNPFQAIDLSSLIFLIKLQPISDNIGTRKISLSGNKLICDCRNYEFAKYMYNKMPNIVYKYFEIEQNFICTDGTEFSSVNIKSLTCDWDFFEDLEKTDCPECICTYRPYDKSALMNCSNNNLTQAPKIIASSKNINYTEVNLRNNFITKLPNYEHFNIGKLDVSYNNLTKINITQLPKNIVELNLEHNNLLRINEINFNNTLSRLRSLTMNDNPWVCDCEAKNTVNFIHKYLSKIVNMANVTCPDFTPIYSKTTEEICPKQLELKDLKFIVGAMSLAIFGTVLGLLALFNSYKTEIKIWLYSHNITWPISEESLDNDKKYDAFISFSHKDEELVAMHLVPGLEGGSTPFKLCLHYRDWVIGDFIPAQIARSVNESRRTIIVLSQHFLDSVWGRTEFRTAYSSALNERRNRIIVILYGNMSTDDLDPELKAYLSMNTYIKWGDYWFWEKLRYALPHRPDIEKKIKTKVIVPDKLNPLLLT